MLDLVSVPRAASRCTAPSSNPLASASLRERFRICLDAHRVATVSQSRVQLLPPPSRQREGSGCRTLHCLPRSPAQCACSLCSGTSSAVLQASAHPSVPPNPKMRATTAATTVAALMLLACAGLAAARPLASLLRGGRLACQGVTPLAVDVGGLKAVGANGVIELSWQPVACASSYAVMVEREDIPPRAGGGWRDPWWFGSG